MSDPQHWFGSTVAAGCEVLVQCELFLLVLSARSTVVGWLWAVLAGLWPHQASAQSYIEVTLELCHLL